MNIIVSDNKNRKDAFWYRGVLAETKEGKRMEAIGEIKIVNKETGNTIHEFDFKLENDNDLKKIKDKDKYKWVNNNWFEVNGEEVFHNYNKAINRLKEIEG